MPSKENTQKVVAKVRAQMAKPNAPESLAVDLVAFVAARCAQIATEAENGEAAHRQITQEFGL